MTEKKEIVINNVKTIADIKEIQNYVKEKGEQVTEIEVVQACINLAKRLGANNWSIYLEVKHVYDKCFKEVK